MQGHQQRPTEREHEHAEASEDPGAGDALRRVRGARGDAALGQGGVRRRGAARRRGASPAAFGVGSARAGQREAGAGSAVEIAGPAALVRDALYGLLLDGADALAEACRAYEAGALSLERLCAAAESATARVSLFAGFEREDGG